MPPLIENDVIFAYLNKFDPKFKIAEDLFRMVKAGTLTVSISSVALIEMELIYRSERKEKALLSNMAALGAIPNAIFEPLTPDIALSATHLREASNLGFFDSHYAAAALKSGSVIISFDRAYDRVKGLTRIDPSETARTGRRRMP